MSNTRSLSEIVTKVVSLKTEEEKVSWLKENDSMPLRTLLSVMYDPETYVWNIPTSEPPYTPSPHNESHGMLYKQITKLPYLVKGFSGENLTQLKREKIFIELLETIDRADAELILLVLKQKPLTGLPVNIINKSLGLTLPESKTSVPKTRKKVKNGQDV